MGHPLIVLWATPRSLSTVFLRIMAERGDFEVMHEPMCDLAAGAPHECAGSGRVLNSVDELFGYVEELRSTRAVFVKETCEYDHRPSLKRTAYLRDATHVFLIRELEQVINSHYRVNPALTSDEVGFGHLAGVLNLVKSEAASAPIFISAERLQNSPAEEVKAFCARAGIAHIPDSLTWRSGHLPHWRRTQRWHEDAAASTQVESRERYYEVRVDNDARLAQLFEENLPFFQYLKQECEMHTEPASAYTCT